MTRLDRRSSCHERVKPRIRRWPAGAVTLELILMLPVWIIAFLAVVEFGLLIANRQQLALASRVGAEEASITDGLALTSPGDPVPANVMRVVQQQLQSSGIAQCKVILEHNIVDPGPPPPPAAPIVLSSGACDFTVDPPSCTGPACDCPAPSPAFLPTSGSYVRVTIYVRLTELTRNLLGGFGLDLSNRFLGNSTTFRHELE